MADEEDAKRDVAARPAGWDKEAEWPRLNRELLELMNELRLALPGATVLFSFLLVLAFNDRFQHLSDFDKWVYYLTFLSTGVSAVLLMAPSAHHRIRWRKYDKDRLLRTANRLVLAGLVLLTLAIGGSVFLVTDVLFGTEAAVVVAVTGLTAVGFTWFVLPEIGARP
jgi:predicted aspartyl protease